MDTTAVVVEAPAGADAPLAGGPLVVRGGTSLGGAVTGALVVYAAGLLFVLVARAVASYAGYRPYLLPIGGTHGAGLIATAGIGAGVLGGILGARFHTRLERRALREEAERLEARTTFADLREAMAEPAPGAGGPAEAIPPPSEGLPAHT